MIRIDLQDLADHFSESAEKRIRNAAKLGETPSRIWRDLNENEVELHTKSQHYYVWAQDIASRCKKSENPEESGVKFLEDSCEFDVLYLPSPLGVEPFTSGLVSKHAMKVCD